jgi:hypothetical protein
LPADDVPQYRSARRPLEPPPEAAGVLRAQPLDDAPVRDTARTGGLAGTAFETPIPVAHDRWRERQLAGRHRPRQRDPAARRFRFL